MVDIRIYLHSIFLLVGIYDLVEVEAGLQQFKSLLSEAVEGGIGCQHSNLVVVAQEILESMHLEQNFLLMIY